MPLIAHSDLPSFERLRGEGVAIAPAETRPDLRIGFLNLLMDGALEPTERQFLRMLSVRDDLAVRAHVFCLPALPRDERSATHIHRYYESFDAVRERGLDALIVTGINAPDPRLDRLSCLDELFAVLGWAGRDLRSTLHSCLATHAVMQFRYDARRRALPDKLWGVYEQAVTAPDHPLCRGLPKRLMVPHSRWNEVTAGQFADAGLEVLIASEAAGVNLACGADGLREVYVQGHPEYDAISLLKEFQRELKLHAAGERADEPPVPAGMLPPGGEVVLRDRGAAALEPLMTECWQAQTRVLFANWLGMLAEVPAGRHSR